MNELAGYLVTELIYEGTRTLVYRGVDRQTQEVPRQGKDSGSDVAFSERQKSVILKKLRKEYPTFNELLQFRNQYVITKNLDLPEIVKPLALEKDGNSYVLVLEDVKGISLSQYYSLPLGVGESEQAPEAGPREQKRSPSLEEFFEIAIALTKILAELYQNRVIHKDIKPSNILINPETKEIFLIDFSIASLLPRESQTLQSVGQLEGTLTYISPEQTGRMNRGIDYRSDFYSLGVTFYQLLTGELPFKSEDPMELIHCHIARPPIPPHLVNPEIPQAVSEIVTKLMRKTAEDRYQSTYGIKHDLELCWQQWQNSRSIAMFELGTRDLSDRFYIPEKLYGRQQEVQALLNAFERVSVGGGELSPEPGAEMLLVAGFSGIGKTAVVNEVHKPIVEKRGYFIKGKFDQLQRNIPFNAFVQAFRELMEQLLGETEARLIQWKSKISSALGEQAGVIIEVIPELELLLGPQAPVTELSGNAAENRFNLLFSKFIQVFTTIEHPLVIFLDDLQWADSASLKLMQLLLLASETETSYLLLIGAYRDNEVQPGHPLMLVLEDICQAGATVNTITLAPLPRRDINLLVADTLSCGEELALPLTELVYRKTQGNPFFTDRFLKSLHADGSIDFDYESARWQWDLAGVRELSATDDVVAFMATRLQKLPTATQEVLKFAACIGNQFDLATLAIAYQKEETETASDLWPALQEGLILPTSQIYKFYTVDYRRVIEPGFSASGREAAPDGQDARSTFRREAAPNRQDACSTPLSLPGRGTEKQPKIHYKFLHDRVQQAAYSLIDEERKKQTHLEIGLRLRANTDALSEDLFKIVDCLNMGLEKVSQRSLRDEIARLNLLAAQKAKATTAYAAAKEYASAGRSLLAEDSWSTQYDLTLALYVETLEVEYLNTNFDVLESLAQIVLDGARSILDRVKVYEVLILSNLGQGKLQQSVETGLQVLEILGISLSEDPRDRIGNLEEILDLPEMTDPHKLAAMKIMGSIVTTAWSVNPQLFKQLTFTMVALSLEYGNCAFSTVGYSWYSMFFCEGLGDIDFGYELGEMAVRLVERLNALEIKAKVLGVFVGTVMLWKQHLRECIKLELEGIQSGLEAGDFEYGCYCAAEYCHYLFIVGTELDLASNKFQQHQQILERFKQDYHLDYIASWQQAIRNLEGKSNSWREAAGNRQDACSTSLSLPGRGTNLTLVLGQSEAEEIECLQKLVKEEQNVLVFNAYLLKTFLSYLFKDYEAAVENALLVKKHDPGNGTHLFVPPGTFYSSLALIAGYRQADLTEREEYLKQVEENLTLMKHWAKYAPSNYQHQCDLIEAEKARNSGQKWEAVELYKRAREGAKENEYLHHEAIACELTAEFYLEREMPEVARVYLTDAYYAYARWGAKAKVEDLERRYRQLLAPILDASETLPQTFSINATSTSSGTSAFLDFSSAIKTSQALSGEMHLERLLSKLMQGAMENAGATKGALLLPKEETLFVEAMADRAGDVANISSLPLSSSEELPINIINIVWRTRQTLVLNDAMKESRFASDIYLKRCQPKSVLCLPLLDGGKPVAILYLENRLTTRAFTSDRLELLKVIAAQAAISLQNARLYEDLETANQTLEQKVAARTIELNDNNEHLLATLAELKQTQAQLIQTEKMSSLGRMVAGVAHEINNPTTFIQGNISPAWHYFQDLLELIEVYREDFPDGSDRVWDKLEEIELDYLKDDLEKLFASMKNGCERICSIVQGLRTFSRLDEAQKKYIDLHASIDSTIMLLQNRLQDVFSGSIEVVKEYGKLPLVTCYASQLNQVFYHLLSNAIDAFSSLKKSSAKSTITIRTEVVDRLTVKIVISDNGEGMSPDILAKIFDPFFTTKPVGKGTGLGMAIAYQVIVAEHGGNLTCSSELGKGTDVVVTLPVTPLRSASN